VILDTPAARVFTRIKIMGAFFTNLHVRDASINAICATLPRLTDARAYVSPALNSWVTVYTEATEDQDDEKLRSIASGLSRTLKTDVLAFLVHDSDIAAYWLFHCGSLSDEFNSAPDYFEDHIDSAERDRVSGNIKALLPLCVTGTTDEQLDAVLHPPEGPPTFAEEIVTDLAKLLGIDDARASLGFNYFNDEGEQLLPDAGDFEPVGSGAERKESRGPSTETLADILPANVIPLPPDPTENRGAPDVKPPAFTLPDTYPLAIGMMTQFWGAKHRETIQAYSNMFGQSIDAVLEKMNNGFDNAARGLLKKSRLPGLPTIEELKSARDQGPETLAALIAKKTPGQLTEIGVVAATHGLDAFLAALLKQGLDPNAVNGQGRTTLAAAEQHGKNSAIYRLVEAAAKRK
jgi:hypothetical protein